MFCKDVDFPIILVFPLLSQTQVAALTAATAEAEALRDTAEQEHRQQHEAAEEKLKAKNELADQVSLVTEHLVAVEAEIKQAQADAAVFATRKMQRQAELGQIKEKHQQAETAIPETYVMYPSIFVYIQTS
jgi:chromosome segregation ATPase